MFPRPTKRAVIDVGHKCSIECKMCYWLHELKSGTASWEPVDKLKEDIFKAQQRGNNYIDATGGEPTLYPYITELIEYAASLRMKFCIITNAITGRNQTLKILESGIDDWLVSVHDHAMKLKGGINFNVRERQERFLRQVQEYNEDKEQRPYRFNCCMSRDNQEDLVATAEWAVRWKPRIFNFINMNPHNDWQKDVEGTKQIIGDMNVLEKQLCEAIPILLEGGVGVNVRYYPMCRLPEVFRMHVCNDSHVCLSGDTKIRLLDGSTQTIKELSSKYKANERFYVYSLNNKNELMAGIAHSPRVTGRNKKCIKLTLDNGETLTCTPDHLLRLRSGEYIKAIDSIGKPLAPFKTKKDKRGYERYYDQNTNVYKLTHKQMCGKRVKDRWTVRHHINFKKEDNRPANLNLMSWDDHRNYHISLNSKRWENPEFRERVGANISKGRKKLKERGYVYQSRLHSPESREKMSNSRRGVPNFKLRGRKASPETRKKQSLARIGKAPWNVGRERSDEVKNKISKMVLESYKKNPSLKIKSEAHKEKLRAARIRNGLIWPWHKDEFREKHSKRMAQSQSQKMNKIRAEKILKVVLDNNDVINEENWEKARSTFYRTAPKFETACTLLGMNHKVISIEDVGMLEEVYDITVNKYHNFALDCGIFVHNCFDPYEWDYNIIPKTFQAFLKAAQNMSRSVEWNGLPCLKCDLKFICGGINSAFFRADGRKDIIQAVKLEGVPRDDFYHYRRHNKICLTDRTPDPKKLYFTIATDENFAFVPLFIRQMMIDNPEDEIAVISDHCHHETLKEIVDKGIGYGIYGLVDKQYSAKALEIEGGIKNQDEVTRMVRKDANNKFPSIYRITIEESEIIPGDKNVLEMYRKCGMLDERIDQKLQMAYPESVLPPKKNKPKPKKKPALAHYNGNLLIYTLCDKDYEWYIPLFARSMAIANPKQEVEIGVVGDVNEKILDLINNDKVTIFNYNNTTSEKYATASLRFLLVPKQSAFTHYLITDIDMMFMPEASSIIDQHCKHMERDGTLCYENWISQYIGGDPRMPGVHFVTQEWFEKTESIRKVELNKLLEHGAKDYYYDEVMLGRLVRDSGLPLPPQIAKLWRHHGIHLGDWRINMDRKGKTIPQNVFQKMHIQTLLKDEKFMELAKICTEHIPLIGKVVKKWPLLFK